MPRSSPDVIIADRDPASLSLTERAQVKADAMYRAALDCCYHHERYGRLLTRPALEAEHRLAGQMCALCDEALGKMAAIYEGAAARLQPEGEHPRPDWWQRANALWHASREYHRRHGGCDRMTRRLTEHGPDALAELMVEFELEQSALMALRQAAEAYHKVRPDLA